MNRMTDNSTNQTLDKSQLKKFLYSKKVSRSHSSCEALNFYSFMSIRLPHKILKRDNCKRKKVSAVFDYLLIERVSGGEGMGMGVGIIMYV